MPPLGDLSDDAVAEQLKNEAKENSIKYSALGVDAFLPKRPANPKLRPNTRFLKAIIKETNSHNAALRKRDSSRDVTSSERGHSPRQLDRENRDVKGSLRQGKQPEDGEEGTDRMSNRSRRRRSESEDEQYQRRRHRDRRRNRSKDGRSRSPHKKHGQEHRYRYRAEFSEHEAEPSQKRKRRHHHRSRSPATHGRRGHFLDRNDESTARHRHKAPPKTRSTENSRAEDSDPLEQIIGSTSRSKAPVPRGRGANKSGSKMDEHFSANYNPAMDVQPDSADDDDWGQALEALRDRQRWKEQGANRLREAGFSEKEVNTWERGGEQREEDIRWKRTGEDREWDRGKTADGSIDIAPNWPH